MNAPKNHPHKWDYFRRVERGVYEILPAHRREKTLGGAGHPERRPRVAGDRARYETTQPLGDSIHASVSRGEDAFVAECLEVAVVTQGRTLDEVTSNLKDAVGLHLEDEQHALLGLTASPRIVVTYELRLGDGEAH